MYLSPFLQKSLQCIEDQPKILKKQLSYDTNSFKTYVREHKVDRIILLGCGDSYFVAQAGEFAVRQLCPKFCTYTLEAGEFSYFSRIVTSSSLIFAISASGRTLAVKNAVKTFRERTKHIFLLTDASSTPQPKDYQAVLSTQTKGPYALPPTKTTVSAILLLFRHIFSFTNSRVAEINSALINLPQIVDQILRDKTLEQRLLVLTKDAKRIWLVGQGGGAIAAVAGATKIHEFGCGRSAFCQIEEFAHHGILGVDSGDSVILVGKGDPYTEIFADAMQKIGVSFYHLHLDEIVPKSSCREIFYPITHLIPLQKLAFNLCLAKNLNPMFFREPHASLFKIYS
ncbi:MAG: SIS domain-containing protein [Promethearchaeota archaeon]